MSGLYAVADETAARLAEDHPTPAFVHRLDLALERLTALREVLPPRVDLAYAVKANPGPPLLEAFARGGAWFDCASAGEVSAVSRARSGSGLTGGGGMVLAGPGKSLADLRAAVSAGARVQVDGIEDVARLDRLRQPGRTLPVSVRVNPASGIDERATIIGGAGPSPFGVDEEALPDFLARAAEYPAVPVTGLQVFAASNELDATRLLGNHAVALEIGRRLAVGQGVPLDLIDLGGGLGIPYDDASPSLDITALGTGLGELLDTHSWFTGRLLLEPGRWLVGPTGVYLTRVVRVKESRGTAFAVLEGGINHLLRPLLTGQSFPVRLVAPGAREREGPVRYTLTGPLCTSLDRVGQALLPRLAPGDVLAFGQAGAYALTQAMSHFLSHPEPAQHWLP